MAINILNSESRRINIVAEIGSTRFQLESLEQAEALMTIMSKALVVASHLRPKTSEHGTRRVCYRTGELAQLTIDLESNGIISKEELDKIIAADEAELAEQEDAEQVEVAA